MHYRRWYNKQPHKAPRRPPPCDKAVYLATLTDGELVSYCTGVLSRASITGDPVEIAEWQELVRQAVKRTPTG